MLDNEQPRRASTGGRTLSRRLPLAALLLLAAACDQPAEIPTETPLRPVKTLTIASPEQSDWKEFPGVVKAASSAELGFRVGGKLQKMLVREGEPVESGQLLAQLDDTDYRIQLEARQAEYNQAKADFVRAESLIKRNLIARTDYDKLKTQWESAGAALKAARQNIEYTHLRAPFAGRIARRYVENFEEVSARQAVYALQDISEMSISVDIPESIMIRVRAGANPKIYAAFDQIPGQRFPLAVKSVSTEANRDTNTFEVTLSMPNIAGYNVLPGMSVTVRGERDEDLAPTARALYLPAHAVLEDSNGRFVYTVARNGDDRGTVERRAVTTGKLTSLGLEVLEGIDSGDEVVVAGMSKMHPGLEVSTPWGDGN